MIGNVKGLNKKETTSKKRTTMALWEKSQKKNTVQRENSQIQWLKEGYRNINFFHGKVKFRAHRNHIGGISKNVIWILDLKEIRCVTVEYFSGLFQGDNWVSPTFE